METPGNFSEGKARERALEAEERLRESRRGFLKTVGAGAALAAGGAAGLTYAPNALAYGGPYAAAFGLDPSRLFMNIGTTGAMPNTVVKNLDANTRLIARDPTVTFNTQEMRNTIAAGFGADPNEIVMSFNTTDGMSKILNGCVFGKDDEIITTNMEHPGGNSPMQMTVDRRGVVLKRVNLPTNDACSDGEILARFDALLTANTRAICFSSPPFLTGIRMPEKELCQWAAANGLISIIDGAHGPGMLNLNFHDIGCDFYAGAGHKWQCGPGQTGILYVRNNFVPDPYTKSVTVVGGATVALTLPGYANTSPLFPFFPTISGAYTGFGGSTLAGGVRNPAHNVAAQLMSIGNPSYPALRALQESCTMWDSFPGGRQAIEDYVVALAQYLRSSIAGVWGQQSMATVYDPGIPHFARIALTSFNPFSPGYDYNADLTPAEAADQTTQSGAAVTALRDTHNVVIRNTNVPHSLRSNPAQNAITTGTGATSSHPLRISTHLFHNTRDVDNLVNKLLLVVPHP